MSSKCSVCGTPLDNGQPQANGMCIDCFADEWGKTVEREVEAMLWSKQCPER